MMKSEGSCHPWALTWSLSPAEESFLPWNPRPHSEAETFVSMGSPVPAGTSHLLCLSFLPGGGQGGLWDDACLRRSEGCSLRKPTPRKPTRFQNLLLLLANLGSRPASCTCTLRSYTGLPASKGLMRGAVLRYSYLKILKTFLNKGPCLFILP